MLASLTRGLGILLAVVLAVVLWQFVLAFVAVGVLAYLAYVWRQWRAVQHFRRKWRPEGKDLLIVYSNSPHWQRYVEDNWLPKWGDRAVVLNWSNRRAWMRENGPEIALFRAFAGSREFNPLGIVVPAAGRHVRVVRFWRAFRDFKHGKVATLTAAEVELENHLKSCAPHHRPKAKG
jgi:hypothetical protein